MAISPLFLGVGALAIITSAGRLVQVIRYGGGPALPVTGLLLGAALVALSPPVQVGLSVLYPSLGRLLSNVLTLAAAHGILLIVAAPGPNRIKGRVRRAAYLASTLILIVSFFVTVGLPHGVGLFGGLYRNHPTLVVYIATYTVYLTIAVAEITALASSLLRAARGSFRIGLGVVLVACVLLLAYLVDKAISVINEMVRGYSAEPRCASAASSIRCMLSVAFPALSVLLLTIGVMTIVVAPVLIEYIGSRRAISDLMPLHDAVLARVPAAGRYDRPAARGSRLITMIIEIRDGFLALSIQGGTPCAMADALRRAQPGTTGAGDVSKRDLMPEDFRTEVMRLRAVAAAYQSDSGAS
jgi:hypothetical protein